MGERIEGDHWERFLEELVARMPDGGRVLDLGCGDGVKTTRLAGRFEIVGVDLSEEQLRLAGANVPDATGGLFLASLSHVGGDDWAGEWLDVEMFFSGFDAETNRRLIRKAGLEVLLDERVWMRAPQGDIAFLWVLARKRSR